MSRLVRFVHTCLVATTCLSFLPDSRADESKEPLDNKTLETAALRGLEIIEKGASNYPEQRSCFSCHHQTLPVLAMDTARDRGLAVDHVILKKTVEFAHRSFAGRIASMKEGRGVGGGPMTVGYGLWTMELGGRPRDETTSAMVTFLLKRQEKNGSWKRATERPPLSESHITCTVLAIHYMQKYADDSQRDDVKKAVERARPWLETVEPKTQEDRNSLLGGLALIRAKPESVARALSMVLAAQQPDGGWAQMDGMKSDAYATGQTLFTLRVTRTKTSDAVYRRGLRFLLRTQQKDGSWYVETRSKPIQIFFDNGDPHGKSQFISISATAWATTALALAIKPPRR